MVAFLQLPPLDNLTTTPDYFHRCSFMASDSNLCHDDGNKRGEKRRNLNKEEEEEEEEAEEYKKKKEEKTIHKR